MADVWVDVDTALAEAPVNILPLISDSDFKTINSSIVYNSSGMALKWNFVTTAGAMSQTAVTPTTSGDYDWASQGNGIYSIEIPASGGASINNDTEGFGWFTGVVTGVLPWRGPIIGFRAAALNNSLIDAGTTGLLAPTTAARTLDVSAAGNAGIDWSNVEAPTTTLNLSGTSTLALEPTTAGRKLDVSTGGEAGVDWANVGSPTTSNNLSGTTISTSQVVASVTGNVGGNVTGSVGSVVGAVGSVTGNVGGNVTGSVGSVASGGITTASFASGAIDAAAIATDAIGANEFAQAAADKVWATTTRQLTGTQTFNVTGNITGNLSGSVGSVTGNVGGNVTGSVGSVVGAVGSVTGNVGGNVTGSVGSVAAGGITASSIATGAIDADALAADAVAEIADGVWDEQVDGTVTGRQSIRLANSANGAKLSGAATTNVLIRDLADTKNRVDATVDASGNRTAVTRDLT